MTISETRAEDLCTDLFENARDHYAPTEHNAQGDIVFETSPLDDMWLSKGQRCEKRVEVKCR